MKKKYIELEAEESGDEGKHSVNSTEDENEDNDEVKDATLYVSNLTKLISSIIPLVDKNGNTIYGKFLGRNALYKISALIKKAEMDNMKKNPTTFESFISNPTKMLKYYLNSSGYDSLIFMINDLISSLISSCLYLVKNVNVVKKSISGRSPFCNI